MEIYNRFLKLASEHVIETRQLNFYSQKIGVSKKHLSETIKKVSGKPSSKVLNEFLLLEAKVLLNESNKTIEAISYYLNFNDSSAFNKFFKRHTGMTPKKYQKNF